MTKIDRTTTKLMTERLCLRPPGDGDAGAIQKLVNNIEIVKWMSAIPHPYPEDGAHEFLDYAANAWAEGTEYGFALTLRATDEYMGTLGLMYKDGSFWEIGYWLGQPFWGNGYVTEATKAVLKWAFETFGMDEIHAQHFVGNEPSARVLTKCGFHYNGTRGRLFSKALNREVECQWMVLTRPEGGLNASR